MTEFTDLNYYEMLGVSQDATSDEIDMAFREAARREHPDRSRHPDAHQRMMMLNQARDTLRDPDRRMIYDAMELGVVHGTEPFYGDEPPPSLEEFDGSFEEWLLAQAVYEQYQEQQREEREAEETRQLLEQLMREARERERQEREREQREQARREAEEAHAARRRKEREELERRQKEGEAERARQLQEQLRREAEASERRSQEAEEAGAAHQTGEWQDPDGHEYSDDDSEAQSGWKHLEELRQMGRLLVEKLSAATPAEVKRMRSRAELLPVARVLLVDGLKASPLLLLGIGSVVWWGSPPDWAFYAILTIVGIPGAFAVLMLLDPESRIVGIVVLFGLGLAGLLLSAIIFIPYVGIALIILGCLVAIKLGRRDSSVS